MKSEDMRKRQSTAALAWRDQSVSLTERWFAKGVAMTYGVIASELEKEELNERFANQDLRDRIAAVIESIRIQRDGDARQMADAVMEITNDGSIRELMEEGQPDDTAL